MEIGINAFKRILKLRLIGVIEVVGMKFYSSGFVKVKFHIINDKLLFMHKSRPSDIIVCDIVSCHNSNVNNPRRNDCPEFRELIGDKEISCSSKMTDEDNKIVYYCSSYYKLIDNLFTSLLISRIYGNIFNK